MKDYKQIESLLDLTMWTREPLRITDSSAWHGHIPFAFALVEMLRPSTFLELGTHRGDSYCAFCQAVDELGLDTRCYSVDSWEGDEHAGYYDESIYVELKEYHDSKYGYFSRLIRSYFDDAAAYFPDGSFDLLHIDGLHSYEAVKHDFEVWLPKMSSRGVVLFHDINVREREFGVWKLWEEVQQTYPSFYLTLSHGLGVIAVGKEVPRPLSSLFENEQRAREARRFFSFLGKKLIHSKVGSKLEREVNAPEAAQAVKLSRQCQVFFAKQGNDFDEDHADVLEIDQNGAVSWGVTIPDKINAVRIDPLNFPAKIDNMRVAVISHVDSVERRVPFENITFEGLISYAAGTWIGFGNDPQMYVHSIDLQQNDQLRIEFSFSELSENTLHQLFEELSNAGNEVTRIQSEYDQLNAQLTFQSQELNQRIQDLLVQQESARKQYLHERSLLHNCRNQLDSMTHELNHIKQSHGYRFLLNYYRMRDRLIPHGSLRHKIAKQCLSLIRSGKKEEFKSREPESTEEGGPGYQLGRWQISPPLTESSPRVSVIIPLYKGFEESKRCIESVLYYKQTYDYELILINDRIPDEKLLQYVDSLRGRPQVTVVDNAENQGFVKSINTGLRHNPQHDVIILNSDTQVYGDWVDRLVRAAYGDPRVGTVTPLSNNATICTFPYMGDGVSIDGPESARLLDSMCSQVNSGVIVDIPTGVGFCMYIRRDCLDDVGLLDDVNFGKGYGEENDYCMRASSGGWRNVAAVDVFVFHQGSVSFSEEKAQLIKKNSKRLTELYPNYNRLVANFFQADPIRPFRRNIEVALLRTKYTTSILHVSHNLGGGVWRNVQDLCQIAAADGHLPIILKPVDQSRVALSFYDGEAHNTVYDLYTESEQLAHDLRKLGVFLIHIHHTLGIPDAVWKPLKALGVPYDVTIHDYYTICPRINLADEAGRYCGEPDENGCNLCLKRNGSHADSNVDIRSWRAESALMLSGARNVYVPNKDVENRMKRYFELNTIVVREHPETSMDVQVGNFNVLKNSTEIVVGVIGVLAPHKGLETLRRCAADAEIRNLDIKYVVVGPVDKGARPLDNKNVIITGEFGTDQHAYELLADYGCNVLFLPSLVPETYSYTLTLALRTGLPIVSFDIGAINDRLQGVANGYSIPLNMSPEDINEFFISLQSKAGGPRPINVIHEYTFSDYYGQILPELLVKNLDEPLKVALIPQRGVDGKVQASGEIRLVRPLTHYTVHNRVNLSIRSIKESIPERVVVFERLPEGWETPEELLGLWDNLRKKGTTLIYAIDDNLLALDETIEVRRLIKRVIEHMARTADGIIVSTEELKKAFRYYSSNIHVIPNAIDDEFYDTNQNEVDKDEDTITIGYMGTPTHDEDFSVVRPALLALASKYPKIKLQVVGAIGEHSVRELSALLPVEFVTPPNREYHAFMTWFTQTIKWDIGIAPLRETYFNKSKSDMKYIDYSLPGIPGVYSDVNAYNRTVTHMVDGVLVKNDPNEWVAGLESLIKDVRLRETISRSAKARVLGTRTLKHLAPDWVSVIGKIVQSGRCEA